MGGRPPSLRQPGGEPNATFPRTEPDLCKLKKRLMAKDDEWQIHPRLGNKERGKGKLKDVRIHQQAAAQEDVTGEEGPLRGANAEVKGIGHAPQCCG